MSWLGKLRDGLSKSSSQLTTGITDIFTKQKLGEEMRDALEELLITADIGASAAASIIENFTAQRFEKDITPEAVKAALADAISKQIAPCAKPLLLSEARPQVILVVGVNGNGKTTTIGKLAHQLNAQGHRVMLAAADTFRAAAVEQLKQWGQRAGLPVYSAADQADPASVAYAAYEVAKAQGMDALLIDTAGRLHNKANLMEELAKIVRVLKKLDPDAPHQVLQVLDATTGQNALAQVQAFRDLVQVTGLIVTKLDGSARAGVVVALAEQFGIPVHAIGVGEGIDDLQPFQPDEFARSLVGLTA